MSIFHLPKGLIQEVQRLCAIFWWGSNFSKRKMHRCTWNHLCKPRSEAVLSFRDLETSNRSFLAKQGWRILKNPNSLAVRVLKSCYFHDCSFLEVKRKPSDSYVWSSIL
ncbi:hypothetical protein Ddye_007441 [Dipteronia dyeriana]|uniref:Reverse transcriptase n=1 Tax=Dipteronia dyeriana TaxID=168575 RepID=A0AAD9XL10_9ROSI|nr:hypothetical protein Ddye_007441 [Dipteronia dyeriana]